MRRLCEQEVEAAAEPDVSSIARAAALDALRKKADEMDAAIELATKAALSKYDARVARWRHATVV